MKIHFLTQYSWPDGSPVCLISEKLASELSLKGYQVIMVAGKGSYRLANRNKPNFEIFNLDTESFDRNKKKSIIKEYYSVFKNQINYIKKKYFE